MPIDFRKLDQDGNGYFKTVNSASDFQADESAFFRIIEQKLLGFDTTGLKGLPNWQLSNGKGGGEDGIDEIKAFFDSNPDFPYDETAISAHGGVKNGDGFSFTADHYTDYLWEQLGGTSGHWVGNSYRINRSLKSFVENPVPWIKVSEADKELVRNGSWDEFEKADANKSGTIEQSGILGGVNELQTHVMNFVGAKSADEIFPTEKQKEYKERFGFSKRNPDSEGNWQPTENYKISDFANLWFQTEGYTIGGVQSEWSFRRFYGYP